MKERIGITLSKEKKVEQVRESNEEVVSVQSEKQITSNYEPSHRWPVDTPLPTDFLLFQGEPAVSSDRSNQ